MERHDYHLKGFETEYRDRLSLGVGLGREEGHAKLKQFTPKCQVVWPYRHWTDTAKTVTMERPG
jgi:hypothetical protein